MPSIRLNSRQSEWVSPPETTPSTTEPSELASQYPTHSIQPGRLSIECIEAVNVIRKDQLLSRTNINPFLIFTINAKDPRKNLQKRTSVQKNTGQNPSFGREVVSFDISTPSAFFTSEQNYDIKLKIELFDKQDSRTDYLIGEVSISARRFFSNSKSCIEWIPLVQSGDVSSNLRLQLKFDYIPVKEGTLLLRVLECSGLIESESKQQPSQIFASITIGPTGAKRTKTVKCEKGNARFIQSEDMHLCVDQENWFEDANVKIFHLTSTEKRYIGEQNLPLLKFMNVDQKSVEEEDILLSLVKQSKENPSDIDRIGDIKMKVMFLQAGKLRINVINGKDLREIGAFGRMDPYVVLKSNGKASTIVKKTKAITEGGANPLWNEELVFMVVDNHHLEIDCYDNDPLTNFHEKIGNADFSLLSVFQKGHVETWVDLKIKNEFDVEIHSGRIQISLDFQGPHGVAFPRMQPSMAAFDSTDHIKKPKEAGAEEDNLAQDILQQMNNDAGDEFDCGFTEEQIQSSFDFLDLDKNGYIGASEIRHILVGMGELVTDEEVDTMISMLDMNGDGQVSFREFRMMVKSPDPASDDFEEEKKNQPEVNTCKLENQEEMGRREMKRNIFPKFVNNNKIDKDAILDLRDKVRTKEKDLNANDTVDTSVWSITLDALCNLLPVEANGETREVFKILDRNGSGIIDLREFILNLCNFIFPYSVEERCQLMFDLFDDDKCGYLSLVEVEGILVGNHMLSHKAVSRKAQTVMKCADTSGSGKVSPEGLLLAAKKFPNLVFPNHAKC